MHPKRALKGYRNTEEVARDYVILGPIAEWNKGKHIIPVALKLSTGQRQKVKNAVTHYAAYGFDLEKANKKMKEFGWLMPPSGIPATVIYSNKSKEEVVVYLQPLKPIGDKRK